MSLRLVDQDEGAFFSETYNVGEDCHNETLPCTEPDQGFGTTVVVSKCVCEVWANQAIEHPAKSFISVTAGDWFERIGEHCADLVDVDCSILRPEPAIFVGMTGLSLEAGTPRSRSRYAGEREFVKGVV